MFGGEKKARIPQPTKRKEVGETLYGSLKGFPLSDWKKERVRLKCPQHMAQSYRLEAFFSIDKKAKKKILREQEEAGYLIRR